MNKRIKAEEEAKNSVKQSASKASAEAVKLRGDIKSLESHIEQFEEEKLAKDSQIASLREEIAHQEEMVYNLQKEKRGNVEGKQRVEEDLQCLEDKCTHLSKVKAKLELTLDEIEDAFEREKKAKNDAEKLKKKVENDLKLTQVTASELEKVKAELNAALQRKEKEAASVSAKIEDESTLGTKYSKQVKELLSRLDDLEEELMIERGNRAKAEKNRQVLARDIEDLMNRLEDAGSNTISQVELNKKREAELALLRSQHEETSIAHEGTLAALRTKHNNVISDMGEQIDSLNKMKAKAEKDKAGMERDLAEARSGLDSAMRDRANVEKDNKMIQGQIHEAQTKLDEIARALNEAESSRKKIQVESSDLSRQIEEMETAVSGLNKNKASLRTQIDDTKLLADVEMRDKNALLGKFQTLVGDIESLRERTEHEAEKKNEIIKSLSKAQSEIQLWKSKYESEGVYRVEELEHSKAKLAARLAEAEETIEALNGKIPNAEKSKHRLEVELEEVQNEYERTHAAAIINENRGRNFDKVTFVNKFSEVPLPFGI